MADDNSDTLTFEQSPPRRPTLDDLNGGTLENDDGYPPAPGIDPDARAMNQSDRQVVAHAAVLPAAWVHVTFSGGTPSIAATGSLRQGAAALVPADFSVTDNGVGDVSITHAGGKLPPKTFPPFATLVASSAGQVSAENITNGARVRMNADLNFLLFLSGV